MRWLAAVLAVFLLIGSPGLAKATTTDDVEHVLLDWINDARAEQGLTDLRVGHRLWDVAAGRAHTMAATNILTHTVAGYVGSQLDARRIPWYAYGEDIGYSPKQNVVDAATELFKLWKASPTHWDLMMSSRYNYIGVAMSYRPSNHRWFSSLIFTESPDLTGARATMQGGRRNGTDVTWTWQGWDPALQSHTSGLDDFQVQIRKDNGSWSTVSKATASTARTSRGLAGGHWYAARVRARDNNGNVGPWTGDIRVWVP
jgi:Cysteine-rich secretory protein family